MRSYPRLFSEENINFLYYPVHKAHDINDCLSRKRYFRAVSSFPV